MVATADRVSVVVPTHDRLGLVERAVRSVLAQSSPPGEVVVVDDGSRDATAEWIRRELPQVRLVEQPNRGVSAARNRGVGASSGEWIAFLDSDDEWRPQKLERQLGALRAEGRFRLSHTDEIWIRRGNRVLPRQRHAKRGGWIFRHCLPRCAISPSTVLLERRLFEEVGGFDEELPACEDYDLWLRICARHPVHFLAEPLVVKYGGHADQLSRRHPALDRFRIRALEKILAGGRLGAADREAARAMLREKLEIYIGGARKRGRAEEVERCRAKLERLGSPAVAAP